MSLPRVGRRPCVMAHPLHRLSINHPNDATIPRPLAFSSSLFIVLLISLTLISTTSIDLAQSLSSRPQYTTYPHNKTIRPLYTLSTNRYDNDARTHARTYSATPNEKKIS